jgi:hypothetical protein
MELHYDERLGIVFDENKRAVAYMNDASGLTIGERNRLGRLFAFAPKLAALVHQSTDSIEEEVA